MSAISHLKSLQAVVLAVRAGSLRAAAGQLGITPAAVGQRIRVLEEYLGVDLLVRGRSGLRPTTELGAALGDLELAFAALERATEALNFQRISEIHIAADMDWADFWLAPRLPGFRDANPMVMFCINGAGDVPISLGTPDVRVSCASGPGEALFSDIHLPVTGLDNERRIADWDPVLQMEGMPLLHIDALLGDCPRPGWVEWFEAFGHRERGNNRGVHYRHMGLALEAVRQNVGFLVCGLSLVLGDLKDGSIVRPFPFSQHLAALHPYRMQLGSHSAKRPHVQRFVEWLRIAASETKAEISQMSIQATDSRDK